MKTADREAEKIRADRAQDAQDLLANARERLKTLHDELSETYNGKSPSETPEYQRILEDLVANNTLLKHDASELSGSLAESRDEVRVLRDEIESLRASIPSRLASPIDHYPRLAHELNPRFSHSRTESSPIMGWNQPQLSSWEHRRKLSTGVVGLGMGPIGETEGSIASDDVKSGPVSPIADSPKQGVRASPGSAVGYMLNGVPKRPGTASRRVSGDSRTMRNYAVSPLTYSHDTFANEAYSCAQLVLSMRLCLVKKSFPFHQVLATSALPKLVVSAARSDSLDRPLYPPTSSPIIPPTPATHLLTSLCQLIFLRQCQRQQNLTRELRVHMWQREECCCC